MWVLFLSSYMPLFVIFLINYLFSLEFNLSNLTVTNIVMLITIIMLIIMPPISLYIIMNIKRKSTKHININKINTISSEVLNYILVYIIPFITTDITRFNNIITFLVFFVILGIIYVKNSLVYINPCLYIIGYNVFSINENQILISKNSYEKIYTDDPLRKVSVLGNKIYLDCQK